MSSAGKGNPPVVGRSQVYDLVTQFLPGRAASDTSLKLMGPPYTSYALDDAGYQIFCNNCEGALKDTFGYAAGLTMTWRVAHEGGSANDFINAVYSLLTAMPAHA